MTFKKITLKLTLHLSMLWILLPIHNTAQAVNWVVGNISSHSFPAELKQTLEEHYSQGHITTHGNTIFSREYQPILAYQDG